MITLTATIAREGGNSIVLDYRNSLSIERSIFDRSDISMPSWGVISNGGKLKFVDTDGSIRALVESRKLKSGMAVTITLSNTISGASAPVGEFLTENWDYDNDSHAVSVTIKDNLQELQDILIPTVNYDLNTQTNVTGEYVYNFLLGKTDPKYDFLHFSNLDEETQNTLRSFVIDLFLIDVSNLWAAWSSLCYACQLHIYKNNLGQTVCTIKGA